MPLNDLKIKSAKPKEKRYMLLDGDGLYLEVLPSGKRSWRYRKKIDGKQYKLSLPGGPDLFSLREARDWRDEIKKKIIMGADIKAASAPAGMTFQRLYEEYLTKKCIPTLSPSRVKSIQQKITRHVLPRIGFVGVREITEQQILEVLRAIEAKGFISTAHSVRGICGQIFRFGVSIGEVGRDPTEALKGALQPRNVEHRPRVRGKIKIGALMRAVASYEGKGNVVRYALQLQPYVFLRPKNLCSLQWAFVEWDDHLIRIPAAEMKMRNEHIVPLSRQAEAILKTIHAISKHGRYVFLNDRTPTGSKHIATDSLLAALRRLGYYGDVMTTHGFRGIATTSLAEARALSIGSTSYVWRAVKDGRTRESHREMDGKTCAWASPPIVDGEPMHPGQTYNCRCYPEPII